LVYQPYVGAKKGGVVGLMKGTLKGITGAFFKPIVGTLDFISKNA